MANMYRKKEMTLSFIPQGNYKCGQFQVINRQLYSAIEGPIHHIPSPYGITKRSVNYLRTGMMSLKSILEPQMIMWALVITLCSLLCKADSNKEI